MLSLNREPWSTALVPGHHGEVRGHAGASRGGNACTEATPGSTSSSSEEAPLVWGLLAPLKEK